jgi:hypothetical protein
MRYCTLNSVIGPLSRIHMTQNLHLCVTTAILISKAAFLTLRELPPQRAVQKLLMTLNSCFSFVEIQSKKLKPTLFFIFEEIKSRINPVHLTLLMFQCCLIFAQNQMRLPIKTVRRVTLRVLSPRSMRTRNSQVHNENN